MMSGFLFAVLELTQDHTTQEKKEFVSEKGMNFEKRIHCSYVVEKKRTRRVVTRTKAV